VVDLAGPVADQAGPAVLVAGRGSVGRSDGITAVARRRAIGRHVRGTCHREASQMRDKLRVTLVKSSIGYREQQKRTLRALRLHRLQQTVEHEDSPAVRGMIGKVEHLVKVEEIKE